MWRQHAITKGCAHLITGGASGKKEAAQSLQESACSLSCQSFATLPWEEGTAAGSTQSAAQHSGRACTAVPCTPCSTLASVSGSVHLSARLVCALMSGHVRVSGLSGLRGFATWRGRGSDRLRDEEGWRSTRGDLSATSSLQEDDEDGRGGREEEFRGRGRGDGMRMRDGGRERRGGWGEGRGRGRGMVRGGPPRQTESDSEDGDRLEASYYSRASDRAASDRAFDRGFDRDGGRGAFGRGDSRGQVGGRGRGGGQVRGAWDGGRPRAGERDRVRDDSSSEWEDGVEEEGRFSSRRGHGRQGSVSGNEWGPPGGGPRGRVAPHASHRIEWGEEEGGEEEGERTGQRRGTGGRQLFARREGGTERGAPSSSRFSGGSRRGPRKWSEDESEDEGGEEGRYVDDRGRARGDASGVPHDWMRGKQAGVGAASQLAALSQQVALWLPQLGPQESIRGISQLGYILSKAPMASQTSHSHTSSQPTPARPGSAEEGGSSSSSRQSHGASRQELQEQAAQVASQLLLKLLSDLQAAGQTEDGSRSAGLTHIRGAELLSALRTLGSAKVVPPATVLEAMLAELLADGAAKLLDCKQEQISAGVNALSSLQSSLQAAGLLPPTDPAVSKPSAPGSPEAAPLETAGLSATAGQSRLAQLQAQLVELLVNLLLDSSSEVLTPATAASLSASLARMGVVRADVYEAVVKLVKSKHPQQQPVGPKGSSPLWAQLGITARTLADAGLYVPSLLDLLQRHVAAKPAVITPSGWADLLYAFHAWAHPCPKLLAAIAAAAPDAMAQRSLPSHKLARLAHMLSAMGAQHEGLWEGVAAAAKQRIAELAANEGDAIHVLQALAVAGHKDEALTSQLCTAIADHMAEPAWAQSSTQCALSASRMTRALALLNHLDAAVISKCTVQLGDAAKAGVLQPGQAVLAAYATALVASRLVHSPAPSSLEPSGSAAASSDAGAALLSPVADALVALTGSAIVGLENGRQAAMKAAAAKALTDAAVSGQTDQGSAAITGRRTSPTSYQSALGTSVALVRVLSRSHELPTLPPASEADDSWIAPLLSTQPAAADLPFVRALYADSVQSLLEIRQLAFDPATGLASTAASQPAASDPAPDAAASQPAPVATAQASPSPLDPVTLSLAQALGTVLQETSSQPQRFIIVDGTLVLAAASGPEGSSSAGAAQPLALLLDQGGDQGVNASSAQRELRAWLLQRAGCKVVRVDPKEWARVHKMEAAAAAYLKHTCGLL